MIMSDGCFAQTYGYFEIRVKVPKGKGLWPAFWLLPTSHKWPPEIDVFEMFGAPNSRHEGGQGWVHTGTVGGGTPRFNRWHKLAIDQYDDFHTYGLLWGPEKISIYVDGQLIGAQLTPDKFHQPMYLIANLAVGGQWPESPDTATPFPATMEIDYIRAWQYAPWRHRSHASAP
jgi:beta-glucanase (GH16 family)